MDKFQKLSELDNSIKECNYIINRINASISNTNSNSMYGIEIMFRLLKNNLLKPLKYIYRDEEKISTDALVSHFKHFDDFKYVLLDYFKAKLEKLTIEFNELNK